MTSHQHGPADDLRRPIADGRISEAALQAITRIDQGRLRSFLNGTTPHGPGLSAEPGALSVEESSRVSILAAQLTHGLEIADDDRLRGMLESLTVECRLTIPNLVQLTGCDADDLRQALADPALVPTEQRYEVAVRSSYLINAINNVR
ncbi:HTH domain-containing protein [Microbacterium sp. P02]|uniref:HTH domain-containing protein n=1 Tax=Microbacterium sp. P02 TaxID=3366260 RepID=UPI00366FFF9B